MKNHSAKSILLSVLICFLFLAFGTALVGPGGWGYSIAQKKNPSDFIAVRDALRRGGLREAAKLKGHYVGELDPHWDLALFDIELLTRYSAAVVMGATTKEIGGRLTAGGQLITTDYEFVVGETIKGAVTQGSTITVSLPGGRVQFEDGSSAELKTPTFERMRIGATYTIFLSESEDAPNSYNLTAGPTGVSRDSK